MATIKICSKCTLPQSIDKYHKNASRSDGLQSYCKECVKLYMQSNSEKLSVYQKGYRKENKEQSIEYSKKYYQHNREEISLQKKKYRSSNKEFIAFKKNKYEKDKLKSDPAFKLRKRLSLGIRIALKGKKSNLSILQFLPYSIQMLKKHLEKQFESWMTWDNWGQYNPVTWKNNDNSTWTWQLDHIVPQCSLPYSSMEDDNFQKCWALENLRPLSAKRNVIEGSKTRS